MCLFGPAKKEQQLGHWFDGELPENYNKVDLDVDVGCLIEEIPIDLPKDEDKDDSRKMSNNQESSLEPEQVD